tara:strand:+ start:587 stop:2680 length:2094 start_codon:yes stop_codon:yes gene_type:complete
MLTETHKKEIQEAYTHWIEAKGFKPRKGQRQMIAEVARTVAAGNRRVCIVEAGTGTGKTVAYCLASISLAIALDKKLVVATATVALQEQIVLKDLPDILANTNLRFHFVLAKGRSRYVCLKRLEDQLNDNARSTLSLFDEFIDSDRAMLENLQEIFSEGIWNGELDSLEYEINSSTWASVTNDHRGCTNRRCDFFDQCPFFKARASLDTADVIVTNQDMVLADLSHGGGVTLPSPEEAIYIFDEAHHLPEKTQTHFSYSFYSQRMMQWLETINLFLGTLTQRFHRPDQLVSVSKKVAADSEIMETLILELEKSTTALDFDRRNGVADIHRFRLGEVPSDIVALCEPLASYFAILENSLVDVEKYLEELHKHSKDREDALEADTWLSVVTQNIGRISEAKELLFDYANSVSEDGLVSHGRWIIRHEEDGRADFELVTVPLHVGEILKKDLWDRCYGAICTSATLCALGSFERFTESTGLNFDEVSLNRIASPFNFAKLATFRVPPMLEDPRNANAHTNEVAQYLPKLLAEEKSALVIFTSWRQLKEVVAQLPTSTRELCLVQGQSSKQFLLESHRKLIDGKRSSFLLGVSSFSEGIDLPNEYCRHVIIAKLPFASPDDPIDQAYSEWLESMGRRPFMEVVIPDTALRLIQACGRLIRNEKDYGRITLLDKRILTQRYGRSILESLPPYRLDFDESYES